MADVPTGRIVRRADAELPANESWLEPRREDLAALVAAYRRTTRSPRYWGLFVGGISGIALAALLIALGARLAWPEALAPWFLALGWTIALGCFAVLWRRERRAREELQFHCPACGVPLLDESLGRSGVARADLAIASGNCPSCGERILAP